MKIALLFVTLLLVGSVFGQRKGIINHQVTHFELKNKKDTIDFIVFDTLLTTRKPVLLFCQGSLPIPLYIDFADAGIYSVGGGASNFDLETIKKHYHLVIISMPKIPVIVKDSNVNQSYQYVTNRGENPNSFSEAYLKADYLENYVDRAIHVLDYLRKQPWVDRSTLVVAGHSQGARIAPNIAVNYKHVTHVGLFGANPFGRMDQLIRESRKKAETKIISWEEAEKEMGQTLDLYADACDPEKVKLDPTLISWESFSRPQIETWLEVDAPIYVAYGTGDITSELCDLVPLYFIREHNNNLTLKRYYNLEHNFFELYEEGNPNYEKAHWTEVMNDFINWTIN